MFFVSEFVLTFCKELSSFLIISFKVLIIAEVGVNHNGKFSNIKKLIKGAKDADADFVKFQSFISNEVVTCRGSNFVNKTHQQLSNQNCAS